LFLRLLPREFLDDLRQKEKQKRRENNRIYNTAVVMWLMITQRLQGNGTLETGVLELVRGLPKEFWPRPCKRLRALPDGQKPSLSSNTGSYNDARQELSLAMVKQSYDRVFESVMAEPKGLLPGLGLAVCVIDGTSARAAYSPSSRAAYPSCHNQHGESHRSVLRVLVAHDLHTGLAMRPHWGPMYGDHAVSEQALLEEVIDRQPSGSVTLGDGNFGVFSVAYTCQQRNHPSLLRLTAVRAKRLAGGALRDGMDQRIVWTPTREDRRNHPELPADASVSGRLIVSQVKPSDGSVAFLLALFTTLEQDADDIVSLYGLRWNIETDLRTLKSTLQLEQLTSTSPEMIAKEIIMGWMAYNLVRTVAYMAAQTAGLPPRSFSFTRVRNVLNAFMPLIAAAKDDGEAQQLWDRMMYYVGQAKLSKRGKRKSYPRAVWAVRQKFPHRKE
jgi:hypothetical protein